MSLFGAREHGRWVALHELRKEDTGGWRCKHCRGLFTVERVDHAAVPLCPGPGVVRRALGRVLAVLALVGCASVVPYSRVPLACQGHAVITVWTLYEREDVPPQIWWVPRAAQNCGKPTHSGARGFLTPDGVCAGGYSWRDGVNLVDYDGTWEHTALAHEEAHVVLIRNGTPDPGHHSSMFQPGGAVDRANAALAAAHLCGP